MEVLENDLISFSGSDSNIDAISKFSLLFPNKKLAESLTSALDKNAIHDLKVEKLIESISENFKSQGVLKEVIYNLCTDLETIKYRQDVLTDFLNNKEILESIKRIMPLLDEIEAYEGFKTSSYEKDELLYEVTWRLSVLEDYIVCIDELSKIYKQVKDKIKSKGLMHFFKNVLHIESDDLFKKCREEVPSLRNTIKDIKSITVGINLDRKLYPYEAAILSINDTKITRDSYFNKFFGIGDTSLKTSSKMYSYKSQDIDDELSGPGALEVLFQDHSRERDKLKIFFEELDLLLRKTVKPLEEKLKKYSEANTYFLVVLKKELLFFISVTDFIEKLKNKGLNFCKPDILEKDKKLKQIKDSYNINLAIQMIRDEEKLEKKLICNDVDFGDAGRIIILTGPNYGGKTTYLQSIGLNQVLAQAGLFVTGSSASISIADNIFTHFPVEEDMEKKTGRLGEESIRLKNIFDSATQYSLILLNESLSSTNAGESLYIAIDLMKIFRLMGTTVLFTTHLHELAGQAEAINSETKGTSRLLSMVSLVDEKNLSQSINAGEEVKRSYKIVKSPPKGSSYAREIALKHGIDYGQLVSKLNSRGIIG